MMTPDELQDKLQRIAGQAYGEGTDAETIVEELDEVTQRFEKLAEVDA